MDDALKRQIAMDAHRIALMDEKTRAALECEWRHTIGASHD